MRKSTTQLAHPRQGNRSSHRLFSFSRSPTPTLQADQAPMASAKHQARDATKVRSSTKTRVNNATPGPKARPTCFHPSNAHRAIIKGPRDYFEEAPAPPAQKGTRPRHRLCQTRLSTDPRTQALDHTRYHALTARPCGFYHRWPAPPSCSR